VLTTTIDAHLPMVIALVLVCAWLVRGTPWSAVVQCAVPLLVVAMMTLTDERTRLFAYGVIVAAAFGIAVVKTERWRLAGWPCGVSPTVVTLTVIGIVILRWIPLHDVHVLKELIVLAGSITLLFVIPRRRDPSTPLRAGAAGPAGETPALRGSALRASALLAVLAVAVVTPLSPGKMAFFPFAIAMLVIAVRTLGNVATYVIAAALLTAAFFARYSLATIYIAAAIVFLVPLLDRLRPLTYAAALVLFALWPWSGIIARALPVVRNYQPSCANRQPVVSALATSEALPIGVPPHVRSVIVTASGGQMARFKPGRVVGMIEATDVRGRVTARQIRIGDIADFGFMRREQFFGSRNPLPRFSPGEIRGYGASAWVWGSGRTALTCTADIASLRVIAAPDLPPQTHLQIDAVDFPVR
jgi:hypothetical protein